MHETIEREGVRYVLVREGEYRGQCEAQAGLDDVRLYDEAKAKTSEFVPLALTERMLAGESPIRVCREYHGMSREQLAGATGLAVSYLSQVEEAGSTPSADALGRRAAVLTVDIDDLV